MSSRSLSFCSQTERPRFALVQPPPGASPPALQPHTKHGSFPCRCGDERGLPALQPAQRLCQRLGCAPLLPALQGWKISGAAHCHRCVTGTGCTLGASVGLTCCWPCSTRPAQPITPPPAPLHHRTTSPHNSHPTSMQPPPRCLWWCMSSRAPWMPSPPSRCPSCKRCAAVA